MPAGGNRERRARSTTASAKVLSRAQVRGIDAPGGAAAARRGVDRDISALLQSAVTSSTFDALVALVARVLPLRAVVIVSRNTTEPPLVRVVRNLRDAAEPTAEVAVSTMRYLTGRRRSGRDLERAQKAAASERAVHGGSRSPSSAPIERSWACSRWR